jgi:hypothetical protein
MEIFYKTCKEKEALEKEIERLRAENQEYQNLIKKQKEIIQNLIKNNGGKKLWQVGREKLEKGPKIHQ